MERFRNAYAFDFRGERLHAHPGGVLLWRDRDLLSRGSSPDGQSGVLRWLSVTKKLAAS